MPAHEEYEKVARELAKACGVRLSLTSGGVRVECPPSQDQLTRTSHRLSWSEVLWDVAEHVKREGIPLPPSAQSLLEKGE